MAKFHQLLGQAGAAAALLTASVPAHADGPNFIGNVIIDGSLCVGFDCTVGMGFGFDTIVLRENNLRIHFDDTSNTASFPDNDWRVIANSSGNGGLEYFAVEDSSAGRQPFRIEAGAREHALYVEDDGDVGLGTPSPNTDLHIVSGNTPTVRLDQDGSAGFAPQTWDVAGNETNFFIRDVTGGSRLPFRIFPNAPSNSLYIASDGDIGMGTASPGPGVTMTGEGNRNLDFVSSDDGQLRLRLIANTGTRNIEALDSSGASADTRIALQNNRILLTGPDASADEWLRVNASGITTPGTVTSGGPTCGGGCDAVFDPEVYTVPSIEEHAAVMWENKHLPAIGPTLPGAPVNLSEQYGRVLNELEHAHIYIDQLHRRLAALEAGKD